MLITPSPDRLTTVVSPASQCCGNLLVLRDYESDKIYTLPTSFTTEYALILVNQTFPERLHIITEGHKKGFARFQTKLRVFLDVVPVFQRVQCQRLRFLRLIFPDASMMI